MASQYAACWDPVQLCTVRACLSCCTTGVKQGAMQALQPYSGACCTTSPVRTRTQVYITPLHLAAYSLNSQERKQQRSAATASYRTSECRGLAAAMRWVLSEWGDHRCAAAISGARQWRCHHNRTGDRPGAF